ncbi:unnamed protein product [Allacma fusca]|uniref:Uncharacterized protein n=1 Tax=Allacma fusca TaxID=39272 RepID=A0A8J2JD41_9HEXA|nr:unnamed protein product [Allacma fusca]
MRLMYLLQLSLRMWEKWTSLLAVLMLPHRFPPMCFVTSARTNCPIRIPCYSERELLLLCGLRIIEALRTRLVPAGRLENSTDNAAPVGARAVVEDMDMVPVMDNPEQSSWVVFSCSSQTLANCLHIASSLRHND